jgi:hypothetical protein
LSTMAQQARPGFWPGFTGPGPGRAGRPVWPSLAMTRPFYYKKTQKP